MTITVTREGNQWVARMSRFDVAEKDTIKAAGFRFDGSRKIWFTTDPAVAARLEGKDARQVAIAINAARTAAHETQQRAIAASRASTSDFEIPLSEGARTRGMAFFPFQRAGVEFAMQRPATLIADEMGLGKTLQAIGVVNSTADARNILVICPASLKLNWAREAKMWLSRPIPVALANGNFPAGGFVILNYEMVAKNRAAIDAIDWDILVCDESHYLKNRKAQRTHAVFGRFDRDPAKNVQPIRARRKLLLTGTPVLNRPEELWTTVHALDPFGLGRNWRAFHVRYCAAHEGRYGWDTSGASNLDELQAKLRATIMVRRRKDEVLTELPAKRRMIIALQPETAEAKAAIAEESRHVAETEAKLAELCAAVEALDPETAQAEYEKASHALRQAQAVAFTETARVRHRVALAKVPQVAAHLIDCLEGSDGKVIVFAHHHDVADALADALADYRALRADGRITVAERDAAVQRFQSDPNVRAIVCGITAMGVGHTLTASSHVVFAELDWTPGNLLQAEDRAHRIGQRDAVLVQHIVLDGSLDARMTELIVSKMGVIAAAVDEGERLAAPALVPVPEKIDASPAAQPAGERNGSPATLIAPELKAVVHASLRLLAGVCDGAFMRDGAGYNGRDANFGHDLANQESLSDRQAIAAMRMLRKYRRQIPAPLYEKMFPPAASEVDDYEARCEEREAMANERKYY